jgi:TRAP-type transport system periplasmic protein
MKIIAITAILAAGVGFAQNVQSATEATTWKLATGYRADSFHGKNLADFAHKVDVETGGKLKIELHTNNALVKLNDIMQAVQEGKIEAGESIMSSMVNEVPLAGADSVPFVVTSYSDAMRLWQLQRAGVERALAARGMKVLYAVPWPPQGLYSKTPVKIEGDFQNTKMRTYNPTTIRIAELLGAKPVDVPMVEVAKALSEGRMDNMITSSVTGAENKVWSHIKYYYEINAWFPKNIVVVNAATFNAMPLNMQTMVLKAADIAQTNGWAMSQKAAMDATNELKANGIKVDRIPYDVETKLKRLGEKFSREWVRSVGNEASIIFVPYYTK